MSFFGIILTSVITVLHVYVFTRLAPLPWCRSGLGRKLLLGSGLLLWLIFVLGRTLRRHEGTLLAELFEFAGMQWMGSLFLLAAALLAVDLISGFGLFLPQVLVFRLRSIALACGAVLVLTAHVQGLRPPVVEQYEVTVNRLPADLDGIKIAMISDLHLGEMLINADWLKARVQQVQALQPDCIVLVGDIFEKTLTLPRWFLCCGSSPPRLACSRSGAIMTSCVQAARKPGPPFLPMQASGCCAIKGHCLLTTCCWQALMI